MSREHVELATRVETAINQRDAEAIGEMFHPEFEFHSAIARAEGGVYRGVEGMREYFRDVDAVWQNFRVELEDVREAGDRLLVLWRVTGTSLSGVPLAQVSAQVWTWRDGMAWRNESYTDVDEALEAVGLRE
jgi:ketosteroid isomerase-like protein